MNYKSNKKYAKKLIKEFDVRTPNEEVNAAVFIRRKSRKAYSS